jgi:hypothetical protein
MGREDARSDAAKRQGQKGQTGKPPGKGFAETERTESEVTLGDEPEPKPTEAEEAVIRQNVAARLMGSSDPVELDKGAAHPYADIRTVVARNPATSEATMVKLRADKDVRVRTWAMNPQMTQSQAERETRRNAPRGKSRGGPARPARPAPKNPVLLSLRRAFKNIFRF